MDLHTTLSLNTARSLFIPDLGSPLIDPLTREVHAIVRRLRQARENLEKLQAASPPGSGTRLAAKQGELEILLTETRAFQERLRFYADELGQLVKDEYCQACQPGEAHFLENGIDWHGNEYFLAGDTGLVAELGHCRYCAAPQIKCRVCGAVTSLDPHSAGSECSGGCGNLYALEAEPGGSAQRPIIQISRPEIALGQNSLNHPW